MPKPKNERYTITICMDGHVSIIDTQDKGKQRHDHAMRYLRPRTIRRAAYELRMFELQAGL